MFALTHDAEACLLQRLDRIRMADAGDFRHELNRHLNFPDIGIFHQFIYNGQMLRNGILNVCKSFFFCVSL